MVSFQSQGGSYLLGLIDLVWKKKEVKYWLTIEGFLIIGKPFSFSGNVFVNTFFVQLILIGDKQLLNAMNIESDANCDFLQHFQDNVLQFFAKSFSSSPLSVTREIYTSLGRPFKTRGHKPVTVLILD